MKNRGNFANDPARARESGRKGGRARGKAKWCHCIAAGFRVNDAGHKVCSVCNLPVRAHE